MIRQVSEIMIKNFTTVNAIQSVEYIRNIYAEKEVECFPVTEEGKIIGVLTSKDLMKAHFNRIAVDAMSGKFQYISPSTPIWKAHELLNEEGMDALIVQENHELVGLITKGLLKAELGKHIDLLTDLYKSDYIYYHAAELMEAGHEISVIFIDINNFGSMNKELGHIVGDKILKEVAVILQKNLPQETFLCRFGGDEFTILTPYYIHECKMIAEKLLKAVKIHSFPDNVPVTLSAGIAGGRRHNNRPGDTFSTVSNLINIASIASTKAKKEPSHLFVGETGFTDEIA